MTLWKKLILGLGALALASVAPSQAPLKMAWI